MVGAILRKGMFYKLLVGVLAVVLCGIAVWNGVDAYQLRVTRKIIDTEFEGIKFEHATYRNLHFYGHIAMPLTNNAGIDQDIRTMAHTYFTQCKDAAMRQQSNTLKECTVNFHIHFVTPAFMQFEIVFVNSHNGESHIQKTGLLYSRENGKRLHIADIFQSAAPFAKELSRASRKVLDARLADDYKKDAQLKNTIEQTTHPSTENFANFILTKKEQLILIFNMPNYRPVLATMPINELYDHLAAHITDAAFPKLKAKKEEERKRVEEEKRRAQEAEAARQKTRQLVAPNRSNIDCAVMKCIALTYDDGPGAYTNELLDILHSRNTVATFFVLGVQINRHAATLKRATDLHNEVANHSWDHKHFTALDNGTIVWQIDQTSQAIFNATGAYPKLFRPPGGAYDDRVIAQVGMPIALWSADTYDWRDRNAEMVYQRAIGGARQGGTILMHDIHGATVQAAPRIIDELQRQGYVLVTMSELFGITKDNITHFSGQVLRGR